MPILEVRGLSKKFCKSIPLSMRYTISDVTKTFLGHPNDKNILRPSEFWALKDINFSVARGEALAIIGANGAGKSTLLRTLQGIYDPDEGEIVLRGKVTAIVRVAASFHPDYTGRENIRINAALLGLNRALIRERMRSIIEFADIGDFIDSPVKHYSKGMYMRLGFSVAVHCDFDILLIDEALAVGDNAFVNKCKAKIANLMERGVSIVLVTHNLGVAKGLCGSGIWLHKGGIKASGKFEEISDQYRDFQKQPV